MKKLLYITPHLSTGGLPQYLFKKIETLINDYNIYVIEYNNITGGVLVVQRNKIQNILKPENLITLGDDKFELVRHISNVDPDFIHIEEIPEMFIDSNVARIIYNTKRKYKIFETSHDSSFNMDNKVFMPDKFLMVSNYQVNEYSKLNIPVELVEYPIEYIDRPDRDSSLIELGLDPSFKHIVNVGLFTSRKNQAEIVEYARKMGDYKIMFHFIGNQADNFRSYWEPIMSNFPSNCKWWGERTDVNKFYQSMDLFLFTSRGTEHDKETNPLVIRESVSYQIPGLIYNLPVYLGMYDKYKTINYLSQDFNNNIDLIIEHVGLEKIKEPIKKYKDAFIVSTYPNNSSTNDITLDCVKSLKNLSEFEGSVILTSHYPVSTELQKNCEYYVYDSNNILTKHDFYSNSWYNTDEYRADINLRAENNDSYHGPSVYTNYYNAIHLAYSKGVERAFCLNYDMILDSSVYSSINNRMGNSKGYFTKHQSQEGLTLRTVFFVIDTEYFVNTFPKIENENDYKEWQLRVGSESNGLENIFYHQCKNDLDSMCIVNDDEFYSYFRDSNIDVCSMIEYFTVLPVKDMDGHFVVWYSSSNDIDNRNAEVTIGSDSNLFAIGGRTQWHSDPINFYKNISVDGKVHIRLWLYDVDDDSTFTKKYISVDTNYFNNLKNNGLFQFKKQ